MGFGSSNSVSNNNVSCVSNNSAFGEKFYAPFTPKLRHYFKVFFRQSFLKEMAETDIALLIIKHYKNTS